MSQSTRDQIKDFERQLAEAEADAKRAINRVDSLRQVVRGLKSLLSATEPEGTQTLFTVPPARATQEASNGDSEPLTGREAVRRVLIESRQAWKIPDLAAEIQRRGWMPGVASPRDATAASTQRLWKIDQEVERVGHGVYRYRLDKLPPIDVADKGATNN